MVRWGQRVTVKARERDIETETEPQKQGEEGGKSR